MKNNLIKAALLAALTLGLGACAMTETSEKAGLPDWRPMWNFVDGPGTEAKFRDAISVGEAAGDDEYVLIVTTQLARTRGLQREFADAHGVLDSIEGRVADASLEVRMRFLLERGRVLNSSGKRAEALVPFEAAWDLGQGQGQDGLTADAGHMLAIAAEPDAALEWALRTMAFCEGSSDEGAKGWLGPLYNNTGWTYHDMGDLDAAMGLWEKSLAFREAAGEPNSIFISRWTIARCLRSMEKFQEALDMQLDLQRDRDAAEMPGDGYVPEEIGECLLALGRGEDAKPHFAAAYELLSKDGWLQANEPDRIARLWSLGADE